MKKSDSKIGSNLFCYLRDKILHLVSLLPSVLEIMVKIKIKK